MKNKSVADFVASTMDAALKSDEYKSLFGTQYKYASEEDENHAKSCSKCGKDMDSCMCGDSAMADDNEAKKKKDSSGDSSKADDNEAKKKDSSDADDNEAKKKDSSGDSSKADDEEKVSSAFDVAIDSLLTASAALDKVGMEKSATFSLKLASLVVEAKKKEKDSKKKDSKKDSKKSDSKKSDSNSAKDKKSDSKKDSKKSDSKSSSSSSSKKK